MNLNRYLTHTHTHMYTYTHVHMHTHNTHNTHTIHTQYAHIHTHAHTQNRYKIHTYTVYRIQNTTIMQHTQNRTTPVQHREQHNLNAQNNTILYT